MSNILTTDIETIPGQSPAIRGEIAEKFKAHHEARAAQLRAEASALKPPANIKDPAKIEAWERDTRPGKAAALEVEAVGELGMADLKTEDEWRKTSFDGALGQIVVIGFALNNAKPFTLYEPDPKKCLTLAAEAKILREFFKALDVVPVAERHAVQVVGHNVVDFDLRFIWQRAVVHGITPPYWMPWHAKPWGDRVFDTMVAWAGARGRISQDKLCKVLGIAGKGSEIGDEIDGSKVWDFVKAGRIADVAKYCGGDVERAREMHQRMTFAEVA